MDISNDLEVINDFVEWVKTKKYGRHMKLYDLINFYRQELKDVAKMSDDKERLKRHFYEIRNIYYDDNRNTLLVETMKENFKAVKTCNCLDNIKYDYVV